MIKKAEKRGLITVFTVFVLLVGYLSFSYLLYEGKKETHYRKYHDIRPQRHEVQKDIFLSGTTNRPHIAITSDLSDLIFIQKNKRIDCMEKLENISCWQMDDQIRHFTAQRGIYYFLLHQFLAEDLHIRFFHSIQEKEPFMQGKAQKATFSLNHSSLSFEAEDFEANMHISQDEK